MDFSNSDDESGSMQGTEGKPQRTSNGYGPDGVTPEFTDAESYSMRSLTNPAFYFEDHIMAMDEEDIPSDYKSISAFHEQSGYWLQLPKGTRPIGDVYAPEAVPELDKIHPTIDLTKDYAFSFEH
ncbi:hypothetical protein DXG01_016290 [Tephrocybe rancida]|nr:hypothetical protein DXG01_016290 [Tephrocybe rancida]